MKHSIRNHWVVATLPEKGTFTLALFEIHGDKGHNPGGLWLVLRH